MQVSATSDSFSDGVLASESQPDGSGRRQVAAKSLQKLGFSGTGFGLKHVVSSWKCLLIQSCGFQLEVSFGSNMSFPVLCFLTQAVASSCSLLWSQVASESTGAVGGGRWVSTQPTSALPAGLWSGTMVCHPAEGSPTSAYRQTLEQEVIAQAPMASWAADLGLVVLEEGGAKIVEERLVLGGLTLEFIFPKLLIYLSSCLFCFINICLSSFLRLFLGAMFFLLFLFFFFF